MSNGLLKIHHGIMKSDALKDYNNVKAVFEKLGKLPIEPKGRHWHKIEDATAEMLHQLPATEKLVLHRGLSYYLTLKDYK